MEVEDKVVNLVFLIEVLIDVDDGDLIDVNDDVMNVSRLD